ncbi:hypothetical protein FACS189456_4940 [Bacteroidia bacterium]|nr:hypothetical protein FACS189456_4940 [Bacteroidia bacterium]
MRAKNTIVLTLCIVFSTHLFAQRTARVCGEYIYHAPKNVSLEQAERTALERAKLVAIAEEFNTQIFQIITTVVKNENEKSDVIFRSISESEVKGEWLEDTKKPEYSVTYEQNMLVVKVTVCGKVREIKGAGVDFSAKVLRNGTTARDASSEFVSGNYLYLLFQSPADGYLAVYLVDDAENAQCLLPYATDASGKVAVQGSKEYVFFSQAHAGDIPASVVDEYQMRCEKPIEQNILYLIFSPHEFTKANDTRREDDEVLLPRELSFEDFQKWLAKNRGRDKDMRVDTRAITIKK